MGPAGPASSPQTLPGPVPPSNRRVGPVVGVAAGVAAGLLVAGAAAYAFWPDDKPATPVATTGGPVSSAPTTAPASPKPSGGATTAEKSGHPSKSPTASSSPSESASPPDKKAPKGTWTAPAAAPGIVASGGWDITSGEFVGTLVLRMNASKGWAVFEHQHSNGGPNCDYGVEFAKPGETHTASFGSKCTGMFRVRTCLAKSVDTSGTYPQIAYDRCTAWRTIFQ